MAGHKTTRAEHRLMKLTAFLLRQSEPVSIDLIREALPDLYAGTAAALDRKWTRDKQALLAAGVPIAFVDEPGQPHGYVINRRHFYLPDLGLTPEEAAVLWTLGQAAVRMEGNPWREDLELGLRKLRAGATPDLPPRLTALNLHHGDGMRSARRAKILETIGEAVRSRRRVRMSYFTAARGQATEREVDVYGFAWRRGVWLFAGHCHLRNALRVFYVNRVERLQLASRSKKSAAPEYEIPRDFDIRTFSLQEPWDFWSEPPREAKVRLEGTLAPLASRLLPRARLEPQPDGAVVATLTVRNLEALVRHVLSFGPEAELLSPEEGRAHARRMLDALADSLRSDEVAA